MQKSEWIVAAMLSLAASTVSAQVSIQALPDPKDGCKQLMVSSNSDHVWQIEVSYKYVGQLSNGQPWEHSFVIPITVYPQASYHWASAGIMDCSRPYTFNSSWTGYDATARAAAEAKRIEDSRKEVIRNYLEREEQVKRQNEEFKRKKEAEAEARRQAELDRKQHALQQQQYMRELQEKAKRDNLQAYRNASPENARCIINDQADIANCEKWKAREREEKIRSDAEARRAQQQRDIEARAAADMERMSAENVEKAKRDMEANNCAYAAGLPARIPYPTVNTNNAQYQADIKRIDALNFEAQQKFFRETKAASDACDARKASRNAAQQQQVQMQQQQLLQQQRAQQLQAEQQRRLQAQQKAQADLNAAIQDGKKAADAAASDTQKLKNGNASLMDMINNMK